MTAAQDIIDYFKMQPLELEGGFYVETYRCTDQIDESALPGRYHSPRAMATAILYLLTADTFLAMHRLTSDEIWHFHLGDPVEMLLLKPDGSSELQTLGHDVIAGQRVQTLVERNTWQGARVIQPGQYALMGTTVVPGFDTEDLELANRQNLLQQYPNRANMIEHLTR